MAPTNKIKIISFNCKGFKYRNFPYLKELSNNCDIMLIQESWLHKFEIDKINKFLPNFMFHATFSMDDTDITRMGRPYGGCLILWRKKLNIKIKSIETISDRICAVEVKDA